jgi:hypothetical protein
MKIEKLIAVKKYLDLLIKQQNNIEKMLDCESEADFENTTQKNRAKTRHKIDSLCEERNRTQHELHCLIVEADLAPAYEDDYYGDHIERPNGWHTNKRVYRKPELNNLRSA